MLTQRTAAQTCHRLKKRRGIYLKYILFPPPFFQNYISLIEYNEDSLLFPFSLYNTFIIIFPPQIIKTTYDSYKLDTKVKVTSVYDRNQLNNVISELVIIDSITVMKYMNYSYVLLLDVIGVIRLNCQPPLPEQKKNCYQIRFLLALFGI